MFTNAEFMHRKRADYATRCNLIREERHARSILKGAEEQAWRNVCVACVDSYQDACRREEDVRRRQASTKKEHYAFRLNRNPNSPMPTLDSVNMALSQRVQDNLVLSRSVSCSPPFEREWSDLLLWERENRRDLEMWESEERWAMASAAGCIMTKQHCDEHKVRERICEGVLSGATVLDWHSYPSYGH
ncbi:hypothetical protein ABL78_0415 [Leptomonas seymouri]|uniref:Uncharacterized protein n=1 Tax=Leptomonas seymouri TaxID=5684 RepID=A0A0N1IC33_LEPSE|nr:hypothetical protein ABL78_0415 [Leptomonas seymouri]|eukprot:KPI90485.1 hypothetical protein ABL78_0415 [Leptomonas seymouri]